MKVLLVGPKDPEKPRKLKFLMGGENTFTRSLLASAPSGVEYLHHLQALKEGKIVYTGFQKALSFLMKVGIFPLDVGFQCFAVKSDFDLVHGHGYCLKLENYAGPVVLSDSSSNYLFLRDYLGWSKSKIALFYRIRGWISKNFALYDPNLHLSSAKKLIVWSNFAKKIHQDLGAERKKIVVIPPGIAPLPFKKRKTKQFTILFVGIWFERKGGPMVLEVYKRLKGKYPALSLKIVGQLPSGYFLPSEIWQRSYLPREKLIKEVFPEADVLVLVPPVAEGYGLVVLEAASLGIPAIVSDVYALPEIVQDGKTGFVIPAGDKEALAKRLESLILNRDLAISLGRAAKQRFQKEFCLEKTNQRLLAIYQEASGSKSG